MFVNVIQTNNEIFVFRCCKLMSVSVCVSMFVWVCARACKSERQREFTVCIRLPFRPCMTQDYGQSKPLKGKYGHFLLSCFPTKTICVLLSACTCTSVHYFVIAQLTSWNHRVLCLLICLFLKIADMLCVPFDAIFI